MRHKLSVISKAVVLMLLMQCLLLLAWFERVCVVAMLCCEVLNVLCCFAFILLVKRELVALLQLTFLCLMTDSVLWLVLMVPWVGLQ